MILIHVWADGSFTTQCGGPDMRPWAEHEQAAKHGCQQTLIAHVAPAGNAFNDEFLKLAKSDLEIPHSGSTMGKWQMQRYSRRLWPNAQAWHLWASVCMVEFGAFFTVVTGPCGTEALMDRLERLIRTRGEVSLGILVNLVRPISTDEVIKALHYMEYVDIVKREERPNPRNKITHHIYSLA